MQAILAVALLALGFMGGLLATYLRAYSKKKGENLATHEDINKVLDEVRAVTTTTKQIEAKISNEVWERQREWELKREVLFEAAKRMSETDNALLSLDTFFRADKNETDELHWLKMQSQYVTRWQKAISSFEQTESLVQISCSKETLMTFAELTDLLRSTASKIVSGDTDVFRDGNRDRQKKFAIARAAIRKELGVNFPLKPRSSESLAAQAP